jgi:uncharacterized protein YjiK
MKLRILTGALLVATAINAQAATAVAGSAIDLGRYSVAGTYNLDILNGTSGGISGLEASAVAFAGDRIDPFTGTAGTLFFVGDEGTGVVEVSRTGKTIGYMNFDWTGTGSTKNDTEALTYLGNGTLVVGEERLFDAYRFDYVSGGTATLANASVSISNATVGNHGMEGLSYDPRDGSFVAIKQDSPEDILAGTLSFASALGGTSTMSNLFDPTLLGLSTLSDVQTLAPVSALAGTAAADNLLILSLGSRSLLEVSRSGDVLSAFDLSSLLNTISGDFNAIEGVTIDDKGTIYLVAEQLQGAGAPLDARSQLIVLTAPVPEPETYAMMLAGLGLIGSVLRRRRQG